MRVFCPAVEIVSLVSASPSLLSAELAGSLGTSQLWILGISDSPTNDQRILAAA